MEPTVSSLSKDWMEQFPTDRTDEALERRQALFREYFDRNGNGFCSLAECDAGIKEMTSNSLLTSPVILRAFHSAHALSDRDNAADFLEFSEFRMFLSYLKEYALLWQLFDQIDTQEDKDRRISLQEFLQAQTNLVENGIQLGDNADATFASIDKNGGGYILFAEFVDWAVQQKLKAEKGE